MFLGIDGILNVLNTLLDRLVVNPVVIKARLESNLPFMASENILMEAVKRGGDRQVLHGGFASCRDKPAKKSPVERRTICSNGSFRIRSSISRRRTSSLLTPENSSALPKGNAKPSSKTEVLPYLARSVEEGIDIEVNV